MFNIGGNDFRLVTEIAYRTHKVFIRFVGTHHEYERGQWKMTQFDRNPEHG